MTKQAKAGPSSRNYAAVWSQESFGLYGSQCSPATLARMVADEVGDPMALEVFLSAPPSRVFEPFAVIVADKWLAMRPVDSTEENGIVSIVSGRAGVAFSPGHHSDK